MGSHQRCGKGGICVMDFPKMWELRWENVGIIYDIIVWDPTKDVGNVGKGGKLIVSGGKIQDTIL